MCKPVVLAFILLVSVAHAHKLTTSVECDGKNLVELGVATSTQTVVSIKGTDAVLAKTVFHFSNDIDQPVRVSTGLQFNPEDYTRIFQPTGGGAIHKPDAKWIAKYSDIVTDETSDVEPANALFMPWLCLESKDDFLLAGDLDAGAAAIFWPDGYAFPNRTRTVPKVQKGEEITLSFFLIEFPKPNYTVTDVMEWYLLNCYSSNPIMADLLPMKPYKSSRFLGYGNIHTALFDLNPDTIEWIRKTHQTHAWLQTPYKRWNDQYMRSGKWITENVGDWWTVETARKRLREYAEADVDVMCYFRQFRFMGLSAFRMGIPNDVPYDNMPPLPIGVARDKYGRIRFYGNPAWRIAIADFCDPVFRAWYMRQLKTTIDFWRPWAISYDMNGGDVSMGVCFNHPDSSTGFGTIRIIADTRKFGIPLVVNEGPNSLSSLFADCVMGEGWGINFPNHSELLWLQAQMIKAYRVSFVGLNYDGEPESILSMMGMGFLFANNGTGKTETGPYSKIITGPFSEFSAEAMGRPIIWQQNGVTVTPGPLKCFANGWADSNGIQIACWNDTDKAQEIKISIDPKILATYGARLPHSWKRAVIGLDGEAKPYDGGVLPAKSLLLAKSY